MRPIQALRRGWLLALLLLAAATVPARAQFVTLTVQGVDELLDTFRYGMNLAGAGEQAKQLDGMLEMFEGFKGIDTKKPWGIYLTGVPARGKDTKGVIYIPVTNEDDFIALLAKVGVSVNKDDGGQRTIDTPFGQKIYMRVKNGYAFLGENDEDLQKALDPAKFAKALPRGTLFQLHVNLGEVPKPLKAELISKIDEGIAKEKERKEGENEPEFRARLWGQQVARDGFVELINGSQSFELALRVDREKHVAAFEAVLVPVAGSQLAVEIKDMTKASTLFGALTESSLLHGYWSAVLNEKVRKDLNQIIDMAVKEGIEKEQSVLKRAVAEKVYKVLEPTLKMDVIDMAVALRQGSAGEPMTGVAALRVKDGKQIERLLKDFVAEMKEKEKQAIKLDADKAGDVNIHVVALPDHDKGHQELANVFGAAQAAIAFHDQAIVVALGKNGVAEVKRVLGGMGRPTSRSNSLEFELHAKAFTRFEKSDSKRKIFEDAFREPGSDVFRIVIKGGDKLHFNLQASTHFLKLAKAAQSPAE